MSFFENNKITEVNFLNKTLEYWLFSETEDYFIEKYDKYELKINLPVLSVNFEINKRLESDGVEFCTTIKQDGSWNTGNLKYINTNLLELSFSRVESYLGYQTNHYFGQKFYLQDSIITETHTTKTKRGAFDSECILALTHEYQFHSTLIEETTKNILTNGWDDNEVQRLFAAYNQSK